MAGFLGWPLAVAIIAVVLGVTLIVCCRRSFGRLIENIRSVKGPGFKIDRHPEVPLDIAEPPPPTTTPTDTEGEPPDHDARFLFLSLTFTPSTKALLAMLLYYGDSPLPALKYNFVDSGMGTVIDFEAAWLGLEVCGLVETRGETAMPTAEGLKFVSFLARSGS